MADTSSNPRGITVNNPSLSTDNHDSAFPMLATLTFAEGVLEGTSQIKGFEKQHEVMAYDLWVKRESDSKGATLHTISDNGLRLVFPVNTTAKVSFFQSLLLKEAVTSVVLKIVDVSQKVPTEQFEIDVKNALVTSVVFDSNYYLGAAVAVVLVADQITLDDKTSKKSTSYSKSQAALV